MDWGHLFFEFNAFYAVQGLLVANLTHKRASTILLLRHASLPFPLHEKEKSAGTFPEKRCMKFRKALHEFRKSGSISPDTRKAATLPFAHDSRPIAKQIRFLSAGCLTNPNMAAFFYVNRLANRGNIRTFARQ